MVTIMAIETLWTLTKSDLNCQGSHVSSVFCYRTLSLLLLILLLTSAMTKRKVLELHHVAISYWQRQWMELFKSKSSLSWHMSYVNFLTLLKQTFFSGFDMNRLWDYATLNLLECFKLFTNRSRMISQSRHEPYPVWWMAFDPAASRLSRC